MNHPMRVGSQILSGERRLCRHNTFNRPQFDGGAERQGPNPEYMAQAAARRDHVGRWLREPRYRDFTSNRQQMSDLYHRFQTGANDAARAQYNDATDRWQHEHISRHFSDNTMSPVWGPRREFQGTRNYNNYIDRLNYGPGDRGSYGRNGWIRSTPTQQDIGMYYQQMNAQQRYQNQAPYNYRNTSQYGPGVPVQQEVQELLQNLQNSPAYPLYQAQQGFRYTNGQRGNRVNTGGLDQGGTDPMSRQIQALSQQLQNTRNPQEMQKILKQLGSLTNGSSQPPAAPQGTPAGQREDPMATVIGQKRQYEENMRPESLVNREALHQVLGNPFVNGALIALQNFNRVNERGLGQEENEPLRTQLRTNVANLNRAFREQVTPAMLSRPGFILAMNAALRDRVGTIQERNTGQTIVWVLRLRDGNIVLDNA